ncbi:hypothetical protein Syun_000780 [Stephania yunnanensis]|uniref:ABC transporter domain-containing protein n=1 Tax=Stephania yunnanensis TaxID=152371 RepID=A0AAP0Q5W0_9MAGN
MLKFLNSMFHTSREDQVQSFHQLVDTFFTKKFVILTCILAYVDVMKPLQIEQLMDQEVVNLSGGELQRVALCLCLGKVLKVMLTTVLFPIVMPVKLSFEEKFIPDRRSQEDTKIHG